jgi:hypothetical protein
MFPLVSGLSPRNVTIANPTLVLIGTFLLILLIFFPLQISLHEEFYKRDIESWRNENSFALDLFVCATHDTSSPSHVLAERWRFSSGFRYTITARCRPLWLSFLFREPAEGEEWNAKAEHAKLQELQGALRAYISTCAIFLIFGEYSFSSSTFH